jgi:hypothetical protein
MAPPPPHPRARGLDIPAALAADKPGQARRPANQKLFLTLTRNWYGLTPGAGWSGEREIDVQDAADRAAVVHDTQADAGIA